MLHIVVKFPWYHTFPFASQSFAWRLRPFQGRQRCTWSVRVKNNYSSIFVQLHQSHRIIILLGHNECEICGINYSDVCDVSREVGDGFLLLAQLTAEFSGLVYQIYNNVLSRHTAMTLQLKLLDLLWQSFKCWLRLTLSCSVFCSKTFTVSLLDFRFCSRQTIFDSFKAKKSDKSSNTLSCCNYFEIPSALVHWCCL